MANELSGQTSASNHNTIYSIIPKTPVKRPTQPTTSTRQPLIEPDGEETLSSRSRTTSWDFHHTSSHAPPRHCFRKQDAASLASPSQILPPPTAIPLLAPTLPLT